MNPLTGLSKIRIRLVLGFVLAFVAMAAFAGLSYSYFARMEQKLRFLSQADGLVNMALEARRYEKNYFLYHQAEDFRQALDYVDRYEAMLAADRDHLLRNRETDTRSRLQAMAREYRGQFELAHRRLANGEKAHEVADSVQRLRNAGKALIEQSEALALSERSGMSLLLREYRPLLVGFLLALAVIGGLIAYALIVRLVRPLYTIEEATKVVAQGDFRPIDWPHRTDEIGSLVEAFNRMVLQLRHNNEQMVQTEKLSSLGTLTSGVAHELNNPLNNISTSCQILQEELEEGLAAYHRELLEAINAQVEKAQGIVGSLLEFARQREFELRPEDLRAVVQEALKLIRGEIPAQVSLKLEVPAGIRLEVDKAHLVQALINLVMNSIQAMPRGGVVTIRGRSDAYAEQAILEIADSGQGMAPDILPRIFDPFFTTKEIGHGTGLGLSIAYGVVERHQGRIQAESDPGLGTKFSITLPLTAERS